jgi:hypothetical protein
MPLPFNVIMTVTILIFEDSLSNLLSTCTLAPMLVTICYVLIVLMYVYVHVYMYTCNMPVRHMQVNRLEAKQTQLSFVRIRYQKIIEIYYIL